MKEIILAKCLSLKSWEFGEKLVGMFILSHKHLKQAVDQLQTDRQADRQTDYRNPHAHAHRALKI